MVRFKVIKGIEFILLDKTIKTLFSIDPGHNLSKLVLST